MEVVLAGASGLIGLALKTSLLGNGHRVKTLLRHPVSGADVDRWDPARGRLDPDFVRGADAVVCLSGVGVGDHRWTDSYKQQIVQSRVDSVATVARTLADLAGSDRPPVLIAASAVGYYGDTGDRTVDEQSPPGDSFLSEVCLQWEAAADPARAAGVRVTHLRTGLVLASDGGLLKRLTPIIRAGIGGKLGDGRQFMPWISRTDEIAAIRFLLAHDVAGPVNLTGPDPVRNTEFTKVLGRFLHRPTVFPVPGFAARAALGEFAEDVLTGQRAVPRRLLDAGFRFNHPTLEAALASEFDQPSSATP
jgi:uncharacterized protein (TIGR01777 family)